MFKGKPSRHWKPSIQKKPKLIKPKPPGSIDDAVEKCNQWAMEIVRICLKGDNAYRLIFTAKFFKNLRDIHQLLIVSKRDMRIAVTDEICRVELTRFLYNLSVFLDSLDDQSKTSDISKMTAEDVIYGIMQLMVGCSTRPAMILGYEGIIPVLINNIAKDFKRIQPVATKEEETIRNKIITNNIYVFWKISLIPIFKHVFEKAHAVRAPRLFFQSPSDDIKLYAHLALTCLQGGSTVSFHSNQDLVLEKLIRQLEVALVNFPAADGSHKLENGISVEEILETLSMSACNEFNRQILVKYGIIEQLLEALSSKSNGELIQAANLLCCLSFDGAVRDKIRNQFQSIMERLSAIAKIETSGDMLIFAAELALENVKWERNENQFPNAFQATGAKILFVCSSFNKLTMMEIHRKLSQEKFILEMDYNIHKAHELRLAVENSAFVVLCIGESFYCDNRCRYISELAYYHGRRLMGVVMQLDYHAVGWLQPLLERCPTVDFSLAKNDFDDSLRNLIDEINWICTAPEKKRLVENENEVGTFQTEAPIGTAYHHEAFSHEV